VNKEASVEKQKLKNPEQTS